MTQAQTVEMPAENLANHPACEEQKQEATEWMNTIGWLPRSYEPELHGVVEDAFAAGYRVAREQCAKVADLYAESNSAAFQSCTREGSNQAGSIYAGKARTARTIAEEIRALSVKE